MRKALGIVLTGVGVLGLVVVHSFRPPEGFIDAIGLLASGRQQFIGAPTYQILLTICLFIAIGGVYIALTQQAKR